MNATNNPAQTFWTYTIGGVQTNYYYLTFTEDTTNTTTPIKFATPPFVPNTVSGILWTDNFDAYTAQAYPAPGTFGTGRVWTVLTNQVEIINTNPPAKSPPNALSLDNGAVSIKLPTVAGQKYSLQYAQGSSGTDNNSPATNANWQVVNYVFTAAQNNQLLVLDATGDTGFSTGLGSDIVRTFGTNTLLDDFSLSTVPDNLYYQPEQDLTPLIGTSAYGNWQLEILDNRAGATNNAALVSWQLQFTFANTNFSLATITNSFPGPVTNSIPGGATQWYLVYVPTNADFATNSLLFATLPLNLWWSTNQPPTTTIVPPDTELLAGSTGGSAVLGTNGSPVNPPTAFITPGGTYYLGVQNPNATGANYAVNVTFHLNLSSSGPSVITEPATNIVFGSATLNGLVTPNSTNTTVYFEYGLTTNYGFFSTSVLLVNNYNLPQLVGIPVTNLTPPGAVYHFQAIATNLFGTNYGGDLTFTNPYDTPAPFAFTAPATLATGSGAQLNGFATPNGTAATAWFEWGTSTGYGVTTTPVSVGTNFNVVFVTNQITGPVTNTAFHFRLVVSNLVGVTYGFDQVFAQGSVVTWGSDFAGQTTPIPPGLTNLVAGVGAGYDFSLALNYDGTVVAWGDDSSGQTNVPAGLTNAVAVAGGYAHSLALRSDRTVTIWGDDTYNQTNAPSGLTNAVAAASGAYHCLALRSDGNLAAWGRNNNNQTQIPVGLSNVVAVAAGYLHSLALKNDGTVVAWGNNAQGQTNVPAGLTNVVAVAAGHDDSLALRSDGTVVAWGSGFNQTNVPASLTNVTAITAGYYHCQALKGDGSVWFWGDSSSGQLNGYQGGFTNVNNPGVLTNVFAISGGGFHTLSVQTPYGLNVTNTPPYWTNGFDTNTVITMNEQTTLSVTNAALDSNSPPQLVFYSLATNAPAFAHIDSFTGIITFAPGEADGPSTNIITTIATDNGYPPLSATNNFILVVNEDNTPPYWTNGIPSQPNFVIGVGSILTVTNTATDSDIPTNTLSYTNFISPSANAPTISSNGIITWTPQSPGVYTITTVVTDFNPWAITNQSLSATNYLIVTVTNLSSPAAVNISSITYTTNGVGTNGFLLKWFAPTNDVFQVQWENQLVPAAWQFFTNFVYCAGPLTPTNGLFTFFDDGSQTPPGLPPIRFYRIVLVGAVPATHTNAVSISGIAAINTAGTNTVSLTWLATTNDLFEVRWTTNLAPPVSWSLFPAIVTSTNGLFTFTDTNAPALMKFYELILLP
jgi:hypothetical protein